MSQAYASRDSCKGSEKGRRANDLSSSSLSSLLQTFLLPLLFAPLPPVPSPSPCTPAPCAAQRLPWPPAYAPGADDLEHETRKKRLSPAWGRFPRHESSFHLSSLSRFPPPLAPAPFASQRRLSPAPAAKPAPLSSPARGRRALKRKEARFPMLRNRKTREGRITCIFSPAAPSLPPFSSAPPLFARAPPHRV